MTDRIEIWADGSCVPNPGKGGWGVVLKYKEHYKELCGAVPVATNNQMELLACIKALEAIKGENKKITIYTDSKYVIDGITNWIHGWITKGKLVPNSTSIKNPILWLELNKLNRLHDVQWQWVKGHSSNKGNIRADELATSQTS